MEELNLPKERVFVGPALIWKRIAAFFIDILILNVLVLFPFRALMLKIFPSSYSFSDAYGLLSAGRYAAQLTSISLAISILVILYFFMMESRMGQTIGKMFMKVYVVSEGSGINRWQLILRNIVFIPIFPFILLWLLDPLFMFFTKTNQRLTEILSKTRTVEVYSLAQ